MFKLGLCLLTISAIAFGQASPAAEKMNKDALSLQNAVNEVINNTIPWGVLQSAKGAYLEGYGLVVNVEIALEPPRNPFSSLKTPEDVRTIVNQRRKEVLDRLTNLLKQKVPPLESITPTESVAIIVNLLNTNPADLPNMASQIVFSVKKQDAASGRINLREYK